MEKPISKEKQYKILIAGLQGVGKSTIISRFNQGYEEFKQKVNLKQPLTNGEDKLIDLQIELIEHNIRQSGIDEDEFIMKKDKNDINEYKLIVIVFDLGKKDNIKDIASVIQNDTSLNMNNIKNNNNFGCKIALWGNKKDEFNFSSACDERTAEKVLELEEQYSMVSYVKSNSINYNSNEPFQNISMLIQDYINGIHYKNHSLQYISSYNNHHHNSNHSNNNSTHHTSSNNYGESQQYSQASRHSYEQIDEPVDSKYLKGNGKGIGKKQQQNQQSDACLAGSNMPKFNQKQIIQRPKSKYEPGNKKTDVSGCIIF